MFSNYVASKYFRILYYNKNDELKIKPVNNTTLVNFGIPDQWACQSAGVFFRLIILFFYFQVFFDSIRPDRTRNFV